MKGKEIGGHGRRELRRGHGREYHNWVALVKGKLPKVRRTSNADRPVCLSECLDCGTSGGPSAPPATRHFPSDDYACNTEKQPGPNSFAMTW